MRRATESLGAAALVALLCGGAARGEDLSPEERAGRRIYFQGESPSGGEIWGRVGPEGTSVPGSAVACAGCHGDDGLGRPEGAVVPSEITWRRLTTPYGLSHAGGRRHPPYDEKTLARAITEGVDPAGNRLDWAMPRFALPGGDLRALLAFLKRFDSQLDPGVTLASVRLGVVLPERGRLAEVGEAIRAVLEGWAREVNGAGGIHGRKVLLEVARYEGEGREGLEAARRLLASGRVAALLSGYAPGADADLMALAEREKVPLVGPYGPFTPSPSAPGRYAFYAVAGLREQARALAEHAVRGLGLRAPRAAVLHAEAPEIAAAAEAARAQLAAGGWKRVEAAAFLHGALPEAEVARLARRRVEVVVLLGGDADLAAFTRAAGAARWAPWLLVPGALASRALMDAPAGFQDRLLVAYPSVPSDERPAAAERLVRLAGPGGAGRHRAAQLSACVAASVMAEGLRRTGRNLSRERLVKSLEGLFAFETGLTPPVSFGPNRRVGAFGAHVVAVDLKARSFRTVAWRALDGGGRP
jgi:ABC-type branched-subunit amino acid transport system substrate-binding protein